MISAPLWLFNALIVATIALSAVAAQTFALHLSLARAHIAPQRFVGLPFMLTTLATLIGWIALSGLLGRLLAVPAGCAVSDSTSLWLGGLFPWTGLPAWKAARGAGVRLPTWFIAAVGGVSLLLLGVGLLACG